MKRFLSSILLVCAFASVTFAQTYVMADGVTVTDCSGTFLDAGGASGLYTDNNTIVYTICPDLTTGTHVQLNFGGVDLSAGDNLVFYDGIGTGAPLIFSYVDDLDPGVDAFVAQATVENTDGGCITVEFVPNGDGDVGGGWGAQIACVPACQLMTSFIAFSNPAIDPVDTGYIDVCVGQRIFLTGDAIYSQNDIVYHQSDSTTIFQWFYGDGDVSYGPSATHIYTEPGGYKIELSLEDQFGCENTNFITQRVRVSPRPIFELGQVPGPICAGDTIALNTFVNSTDTTYNVSVLPDTAFFAVGDSRADSLMLPDGTGVIFQSDLTLTQFSPGATLNDVNDLMNLCINIEHSWMHDIEIWIECPNGQSVILQDQVFLGFCNLGEPIDGDGVNPTGGVGYDYCWTPTATNGNWSQEFTAGNTINVGGLTTLPPGDYSPFESFAGLIGCPLNGDWTLNVFDNWGSDNGFIYSWGINFASYLYPAAESFSPQFTDYAWINNTSILSYNVDSTGITANPNAGTAQYVFQIANDFGCTFDTTVTVQIWPTFHPNCYSCQGVLNDIQDSVVCGQTPVVLDASYNGPGNGPETFEAIMNYALGFQNHPHANPYASTLNVNSIFPNSLTSPTTQIASVCMTLMTDTDMDITAKLKAPNGTLMELTSGNGGLGDNFENTCFTPTATATIQSGAAPFTGNYIPEQPWSNITGSAINGNWQLLVSDGFGPTKKGILKSWSITFNTVNNLTYEWTPSVGLSCDDCPTPTVIADGTYSVSVTNAYGCTYTDEATIVQQDSLAAVPLTCVPSSTGALTVTWPQIGGITDYLVSVNSGTWEPSTTPGSVTINGLANPAFATIQVQPQAPASCFAPVSYIECFVVTCDLYIQLSDTIPVSCFGESDGAIFVSAFQGFTPITYSLDGGAWQSSTAFFGQTNGQHMIIAKDTYGCVDTLTVNVPGPPAISLNTSPTAVSCFGGNDGQATALAQGGIGAFNYVWNTVPLTNSNNAVALVAGSYIVTATDATGCSKTASVTVPQPLQLGVTLTPTNASCFGQSNGSIVSNVVNGSQPYTYAWSNGASISNPGNLPAGNYTVTVTDLNGCSVTAAAQIQQPTELSLTVTALPTLCAGTPNGSATADVLGGAAPYTYNWSAGQVVSNNSFNLLPGTISVTVTDNNGCTITGSGVVTSPPLLSASVINVAPTSCATSTDGQATGVVLGGNWPYLFIWSNNWLDSINSTLSAGNNRLIVMDAVGCRDTVLFQTTSPAAINIDIVSSPALCATSSDGQLTASATGGVPGYNYAWSSSSATDIAGALTAGNYTVTVTDSEGCTNSKTGTVSAPSQLVVTNVIVENVSCNGGSDGKATAIVTGGTPTYSYAWGAPGVLGVNPGNGFTQGSYVVTVTDLYGCSNTKGFNVNEPTPLQMNGFTNSVKCYNGSDGIAVTTASGGTYPYSFLWSNGDPDSIATGLAQGSYTVTLTDAKGCTDQFTVTVIQPAVPLSASTVQDDISCFGANTGAATVTAAGGTGNYTYFWSNLSTTASVTSLYPITYTVTVTDVNNCKATATLSINQHAEMNVGWLLNAPLCHNGTNGSVQLLSVTGGGGDNTLNGYTYIWSTTPQQTATTATDLNALQSYQLQITSAATGCQRTFQFQLSNPNEIVIDHTQTNLLCYGEDNGTIQVSVSSTNPIATYTWSSNAQTGNVANAQNLSVGSYLVTVSDNLGCTNTKVITISQPSLFVTESTNIVDVSCAEKNDGRATVTLTGGVADYSILWADNQTGNYIDSMAAGTYYFTATDANGCSFQDSVIINTPLALDVVVEGNDVNCNNGLDGSFDLLLTGGVPPFEASLDGFNYVGTDQLIGLEPGTYNIRILDFNGCIINATGTIGQPEPFTVDIGVDQDIAFGQVITLSGVTENAQGNVTYEWFNPLDSALSCTLCPSPQFAPLYSTFVSVVATDEAGCIAEDLMNVTVGTPRYAEVASGFSPNGDGNNQLLMVHGKTGTQVLSFRVFDRWGNMVYEDSNFMVNDYNRGWDGTYKGLPMDVGLFTWTLNVQYLDGKTGSYEGQSSLIR